MKFFIFLTLLSVFILLFYFYFTNSKDLFYSYKKLFSVQDRYISIMFLFITIFILLLGVFDFKWGEKKGENKLEGVDIVFVLDVSKSMNVYDFLDDNYKYSRLDVAKSMISDFVSKNEENRYGLVVFAGDATSISPLTTDHNIFLTFLSGVDYRNLNKQGSNFEKAIELGIKRFKDEDRTKLMIILSDGGDSDDKINYSYVEKVIKDKGINSYVFGIGTNVGGKIHGGTDVFGRINYETFKGEFVLSKLNESNLKKLASSLKGEYTKTDSISGIKSDLDKLDKNIIIVEGNVQKADGARRLGFIAFFFFILYLFFPLIRKLGKIKKL